MYCKTLTKPRKWDEESLALATKEELAADLLLRKAKLQNRKKSLRPWDKYFLKKELEWMEIVNRELRQRQEWTVED